MGGGGTNTTETQLAGIQIQTSCYGGALPLVYGTTRVTGNMVDYDDFTPIATTTEMGKGGGSSSTAYTYAAGAILALCEGQVSSINRVWRDKEISTLSGYGLTLIPGTRPQSPWATWVSKHPNKALAYSGMALIAKTNFDLGSSGAMKNHSFETTALLATEYDTSSLISIGVGDGTATNFQLLDNSGNTITSMSGYVGPVFYSGGTQITAGVSVQKISGTYYLHFTTAPANGASIAWGTSLVMADAKPSAVLADFLADPYHGAGWSASRITDLVTGNGSWQNYCTAMGFAVSPAFGEQKAAADHIQSLLDATNSEAVWAAGASGMSLKIVPYGDSAVTANGVTYTPNTTPLYDLTYDDFLGVLDETGTPTGDDAVTVERSSPGDVYNTIPVEFWDRMSAYNTSTVSDPEPVDVAQNGTKTGSSVTMHMITRRAHARVISRILAQRSVYVRNTYKFKLGWKYILLEPMDLVTITDPKLGLNKFVVRIKSIDFPEEGSEEDGMEIEAEEWPFGCGSATIYATQNTGAVVTNTASDPGNANAPVIFDVPSQLSTSGGPELMVATAGGAIWGGCDVWVSADGSTYAKIGTITKPARYGTLVVGMASSGGASIDLSVSGGAITSVAASVATDLQSLMWVNGEIVSYSTATLTGGNAYTLTLPVRGTYGTLAAAHASGASIVRLDDAVFRYAVPASRLGATLYVKLQSFNLWGSGYQDLSACTAYTYAPTAQGTYANQSGASTTQTIINLGSMAANSTNMVKNGNSEDESPTGCQAAGVVASGAFAGLKCRSVGPSGASNTASLAITDLISVVVGDQYYLEAQAAGQEVGATAALQVKCYLADKTTLVGSALVAATMTGTAYAKISGSVTIPATAVWMQVFIADTNGVSYGALFDCLYMGKKISAGILEADLAVAGIIRSPNFTPGSAGASPVGYKASGALFTVTYMDGTTASANLEIGGSVSIGGFPAATIGVRSKSWTTPGTYDWPVPMGVYSVDVTLQAGGQGGRGYGYRTDSSVGNPGTGGMAGGAISFKYPVTQGQTLRFIVGAGTNGGSQVSGAGGVAGTTASVGGDTKFQYPAGTDLAIAKGDSSASYGGFSIPAIAAQNTGLQGTIGQFLTGSAVGGGGGGMCNGANQVGGYSGDKVTGCTTGGAAYNSEWISGGGGSSALGRGGNGVNLISTPNPGVSGSGGAGATRLSQSGARGGDGCIIIKW